MKHDLKKKLTLKRIKEILRALKKFREDREEFIEACEKTVWRQFATTPQFFLQYGVANWPADLAEDIAIYVLQHDRAYRYFDVADTIRSMYTEPEKWMDDQWTLKNMLATHGQPE